MTMLSKEDNFSVQEGVSLGSKSLPKYRLTLIGKNLCPLKNKEINISRTGLFSFKM